MHQGQEREYHHGERELLSRWYEYIGEPHNDDRGDMPEIVAEAESSITRHEVEHALRGMPMKKSPGPDDITTEMLVAAGDIGVTDVRTRKLPK